MPSGLRWPASFDGRALPRHDLVVVGPRDAPPTAPRGLLHFEEPCEKLRSRQLVGFPRIGEYRVAVTEQLESFGSGLGRR